MNVELIENGTEIKIKFVPETEKEMRIMGTLRNHFFFGSKENNTYPQYDGKTSNEQNFVTSLSLKFEAFKKQ